MLFALNVVGVLTVIDAPVSSPPLLQTHTDHTNVTTGWRSETRTNPLQLLQTTLTPVFLSSDAANQKPVSLTMVANFALSHFGPQGY